jgi:hypothetical protein
MGELLRIALAQYPNGLLRPNFHSRRFHREPGSRLRNPYISNCKIVVST